MIQLRGPNKLCALLTEQTALGSQSNLIKDCSQKRIRGVIKSIYREAMFTIPDLVASAQLTFGRLNLKVTNEVAKLFVVAVI